MIDFPITELLDECVSLMWLERHLHPGGLHCPRCGNTARRLFRTQGHFPAYHCRACDGYYTLLTGTVFAKTRQRPATSVLLLRGIAKGEPTVRLARGVGAVPQTAAYPTAAHSGQPQRDRADRGDDRQCL
jgi:hypothetical protein